jgi:hypothetical protein
LQGANPGVLAPASLQSFKISRPVVRQFANHNMAKELAQTMKVCLSNWTADPTLIIARLQRLEVACQRQQREGKAPALQRPHLGPSNAQGSQDTRERAQRPCTVASTFPLVL